MHCRQGLTRAQREQAHNPLDLGSDVPWKTLRKASMSSPGAILGRAMWRDPGPPEKIMQNGPFLAMMGNHLQHHLGLLVLSLDFALLCGLDHVQHLDER
ncbi:unnamed protein product [Merluccius merluccius]